MSAPTSVRIQSATSRDVPALLNLIRALAEYEKLEQNVVATEADFQKALFGPRPIAEALIAYAETKPVGFALFFFTFSTFRGTPGLYLEDLFVDDGWRGHGLGKRMMAHLAGIALARGCSHMEWSVLTWNEPAIRFYRGLGAQPKDEWSVFKLSGDPLTALASAGASQDGAV